MRAQFAEVDKEKAAKGERVKKNHIRVGAVGGWKDDFSAEQEAAFLAKTAKYERA